MRLLLDPPITPFDPPEKIREWLETLARRREEYAGDEESLSTIRRAEEVARVWLRTAEQVSNEPEIVMADPASVDWRALLAFLPSFDRPGFRAGQWRGEGLAAFYAYHEEVNRFLETLYSARVVYEFDWPAWQRRARRYLRAPSTLQTARLTTLRRLLTLHARKDHFCEGHFAEVLESGHITAILKRVERIVGGR